jgi:microcystin degradation protein MlrC
LFSYRKSYIHHTYIHTSYLGAGGYGDATNLLQAMINADLKNACFGPLVDPEAIFFILYNGYKAGDTVSVVIGGKCDPRFGGAPLPVVGQILLVSEGEYVGSGPMIGGLKESFGKTVVLLVKDIQILM